MIITSLCVDTDRLFSEEAFSVYASCMYQPTYKAFTLLMEDFVRDPTVKILACETHGRIIGILVLKLSGVDAVILGIAVSADNRRNGIGRAMIRKAMASEHLESIKAETDDDAIGFYRKCGFREESIIKEYPDGIAVRYRCTFSR